MRQQQEAERFLALAYADRDASIALSGMREIQSHIICFHAQQAIEKALKAVLMMMGHPLKRTHDLSECAYHIEACGLNLPVSVEALALLTPYAVIGRYGGIDDEIVTIDEAISMMNLILPWSEGIINREE